MTRVLLLSVLVLGAVSCSVLKLAPADFSWPVETVLKPDAAGNIEIQRYSSSFNVIGLFVEEKQDSTSFKDSELRIIKNHEGYYFVTASGFKNVYVFEECESALCLYSKIAVSETPFSSVAFNQRKPVIELITGEVKYNLQKDGVIKE